MENHFKARILSLVAGLFICSFVACSKDTVINGTTIFGNWEKKSASGTQRYQFKSDSTFVFADLAIEPNQGKVLGFRYKSMGKFRVANTELSFYDLKLFVSSTGNYDTESELTEVKNTVSLVIYKMEIDGTKLTLSFDCPENASCPASPIIFTRE